MPKRCAYGTCKSDTRYPQRLVGGVEFFPFPKPKTQEERCRMWIRQCGRPQEQLNPSKINKNTYVCSKHFVNGRPTPDFPNPVAALPSSTPRRKHLGGGRKPPAKRIRCDDQVAEASTSNSTEEAASQHNSVTDNGAAESILYADIGVQGTCLSVNEDRKLRTGQRNQAFQIPNSRTESTSSGRDTMEIEYVTIGLDPQVTEYIVEEADIESSFSPNLVKSEHDQDFNECNIEVPCPTLATEQFKLEPHSGTMMCTDVYLDQNSQAAAQAETCDEQDIYVAKEEQHAEVLYQIKDETEDSDSDASGCGWFHSTPTEVGLANVGLLLGESGVQAGSESYICTECRQSVTGKENMLEHLQSHAHDGSHTCIQCKENFPDAGSLHRHVQCEHTHNEDFHCSLCGMRFQAAKAFARHMRIHAGDELFVCSDCGKNFRHWSSLWRHQQKHTHKPEEEGDPLFQSGFSRSSSTSSISSGGSSSSSTSGSTSNSSNRTIPSPTPLPKLVINEVRKQKTPTKIHVCRICGKKFNHSSSLSRHKTAFHSEDRKPRTHLEDKKPPTYREDRKPSPSISTELKTSPKQPSVQGGKGFVCAHCNKCFSHASSFYRHAQTHNREDKPYPCSRCHKNFRTLAALSSHKRSHEDGSLQPDRKVYSCFQCGKTFNHSSSLSRHRHTH